MLGPGSLVTVTVQGEAKGITVASDLLANAVAELVQLPLTVVASSIDAGNTLYNMVSFQWLHYGYRAVVTVSVPADTYESPDDVGIDVRNAFTDVAGSMPTAVQSTLISDAPAIDAPASFGVSLPDIGAALNTDFTRVLLVLGAVLALLVITLGWGKNVKALIPRATL